MMVGGITLVSLVLLFLADLSKGQILSTQVQETYCQLIGDPLQVDSVKFHIIKDSQTALGNSSYSHVSTNLPCVVGRNNVAEFTFQKVSELPQYLQERLDSNAHNVVFLQSEKGIRYLTHYYDERKFEDHVTARVSFLEMLLLEDVEMKPSYQTMSINNVGKIHIVLYTAPIFYHGVKYLLVKALPKLVGDAYRQFNTSQIAPFRKQSYGNFTDIRISTARVVAGLCVSSIACLLISLCVCFYPIYLFKMLDDDYQNRHEVDEEIAAARRQVPAVQEVYLQEEDWLLQTAMEDDSVSNVNSDATQRTFTSYGSVENCQERDLEAGISSNHSEDGNRPSRV